MGSSWNVGFVINIPLILIFTYLYVHAWILMVALCNLCIWAPLYCGYRREWELFFIFTTLAGHFAELCVSFSRRRCQRWDITLYCIVLYCIVLKGWSLLTNALGLFQIYCAPPNLGIRTLICRLNFAQIPIFSGLRFFNEPEISDSGPPAPSRRTCAQDFYVLKKSIDLNRVLTREPWISKPARYPETTEADRYKFKWTH